MGSNALGLAELVAAMPAAAAVLDRNGVVVSANRAWQDATPDMSVLVSSGVLDASRADPVRARLAIDGLPTPAEVRLAPIDPDGRFLLATHVTSEAVVDLTVDLGELDRHPVTGLPGRRLFRELLAQAMTMADRHRFFPAVLVVQVDGADSFAGRPEEFAQTVSSRLKAGLRPGDVVAQFDDSFAILLPDVDGAYLAEAVAYRLAAEVARPFRVGDRRLELRLWLGVATAESSHSPTAVIGAATDAAAEARRRDRGVILAGTNRHPSRNDDRHIDLDEMREEELISYFQPIFDVVDGRVVAGEALMRWKHPHYGVLSAGEFLGLAVNSGMLATLTDQALVASTDAWAEIRDRLGHDSPQLFVNLSPEQLLSRVAVDRLYHLLVATGLPPEDVVVEVTEEAMSTHLDEMIAVLTELRVHGLRVALDDFGSGYSSLGRLRHLPVDVIKVDQSMVRGLEVDRRARQLLAAVSTMADELDVECVVEGIETAGEAAIISDLGFRYLQGYHFARPCPADDFAHLVEHRLAARATG